MAHSISARKRLRQNEAHRQRNKGRMTRLRNAVRGLRRLISSGENDHGGESLPEVAALLDKAAATHLVHRNTAARLKSRLAKAINKAKPVA
ncbi:MAG: 30S ribosomal protein S20 [Candidatus Schekmanbacteria bacterium]|nr:30S ribosomal protein S20 [Candidatus Schekmanbacteria bacterium]